MDTLTKVYDLAGDYCWIILFLSFLWNAKIWVSPEESVSKWVSGIGSMTVSSISLMCHYQIYSFIIMVLVACGLLFCSDIVFAVIFGEIEEE